MINIDFQLKPEDLNDKINFFWKLSGEKIISIENDIPRLKGSPVFTVNGKYISREWTEWTRGFQYGSSLLQYDAAGDEYFLETGRKATVGKMSPHISHTGVHDHGFNNLSTYGNLLRLMNEGKIPYNEWEKIFYELAIKISGSVQACRWTSIKNGGFIYSFNGPHSLFVDTIRSCRILVAAHLMGHVLQGENDIKISLLQRAVEHIITTARYSVFYGEGRDRYDVWGRTAHESIFNINDGNFRCPCSQQGYTGFSTWTRGLAWAMLGFTEELEALQRINEKDMKSPGGKAEVEKIMLKAARATCDFYIMNSPADGIPYWDTGAPGLYKLGDYLNEPANPYNEWEPVDSSAAAIGAQGLLRLGNYLINKGEKEPGSRYWQAGLTVMRTLLDRPYLNSDAGHQGLILHSIYHQPNGWDNVPAGQKIACGESSMWGDYHAREAVLYIQRIINGEKYYSFLNCVADNDNI
jgi:unsaturated chondroitin disaccharide hydrolase